MRQRVRTLVGAVIALALVGYAVTRTKAGNYTGASAATSEGTQTSEQAVPMPRGIVEIDITDILGRNLPAKVELRPASHGKPIIVRLPEGRGQGSYPIGAYKALIHVYSGEVPFLVETKDLVISEERPAFLLFNLLEGAADLAPLPTFDQDLDLAIDSVEIKAGTDPADPASIPGRTALPVQDRVLSAKAGWYRGELHARSTYSKGKETVAELVKRAEKAGLDFLAITDRNTMAACMDPAFTSDSVVLIPAMEWGNDERGVALVYGPRTFPEQAESAAEAQALATLVQAQGGLFAVAHPCFPTAPWQWKIDYVNAVEVWCRDWRGVPPIGISLLDEELQTRSEGRLVHSIAVAASSARSVSANGQAALFWDNELKRGLKVSVIGGSMSSGPKVAIGQPITYVYAGEKSVRGILDGLYYGRTFVSDSESGPTLQFAADSRQDGIIDAGMGEVIPVGVIAKFYVTVQNGKGKKVEVLLDGSPIISQPIDRKVYTIGFPHTPDRYSNYRVQVIDRPSKEGFGLVNVLAMSSPIYAQEIYFVDPEKGMDQAWIRLKSQVPPLYAKGVERSEGKVRVRVDDDAYRRATPIPWEPPAGTDVREVKPQWVY